MGLYSGTLGRFRWECWDNAVFGGSRGPHWSTLLRYARTKAHSLGLSQRTCSRSSGAHYFTYLAPIQTFVNKNSKKSKNKLSQAHLFFNVLYFLAKINLSYTLTYAGSSSGAHCFIYLAPYQKFVYQNPKKSKSELSQA